jgi:regulator of chromosome condensation
VALTRNGRVLTWGVNDDGALGRETSWEAPRSREGASAGSGTSCGSGSTDDDSGLNPRECTPMLVEEEEFGEGEVGVVQVVATDSASFALMGDGRVFGWGTFKVSPVCL